MVYIPLVGGIRAPLDGWDGPDIENRKSEKEEKLMTNHVFLR